MSRGRTVVTLRDVAVRREGVTVLTGVDWRVLDHERWVVLGPNGSGKTTLLQVAAARLLPSAGSVEILGADSGEWTCARCALASHWSAAR